MPTTKSAPPLSDQDVKIVGQVIGTSLGQVTLYFLLRRLGAPKYVAYLGMLLNTHIREISHPTPDNDAIKLAVKNLLG